MALLFQPIAVISGASVLPDNGVVNRLACFAVPQQCGLSLIGDAYAGNLFGLDTGLGDCLEGGV